MRDESARMTTSAPLRAESLRIAAFDGCQSLRNGKNAPLWRIRAQVSVEYGETAKPPLAASAATGTGMSLPLVMAGHTTRAPLSRLAARCPARDHGKWFWRAGRQICGSPRPLYEIDRHLGSAEELERAPGALSEIMVLAAGAARRG
jgi:hypothetical protein